MDVFIAQRHFDYEGFQILGVFELREDAERACKDDADNGNRHIVKAFKLVKRSNIAISKLSS
ncbi:MAG: hypothetical protein WBN66_03620 [Smithella sp.]